jgi:hypothetical protein
LGAREARHANSPDFFKGTAVEREVERRRAEIGR